MPSCISRCAQTAVEPCWVNGHGSGKRCGEAVSRRFQAGPVSKGDRGQCTDSANWALTFRLRTPPPHDAPAPKSHARPGGGQRGGSQPPSDSGLQRSRRQAVSAVPRATPNSRYARMLYSEHVGRKRHDFGSRGDMTAAPLTAAFRRSVGTALRTCTANICAALCQKAACTSAPFGDNTGNSALLLRTSLAREGGDCAPL